MMKNGMVVLLHCKPEQVSNAFTERVKNWLATLPEGEPSQYVCSVDGILCIFVPLPPTFSLMFMGNEAVEWVKNLRS